MHPTALQLEVEGILKSTKFLFALVSDIVDAQRIILVAHNKTLISEQFKDALKEHAMLLFTLTFSDEVMGLW